MSNILPAHGDVIKVLFDIPRPPLILIFFTIDSYTCILCSGHNVIDTRQLW